MDVRHLTPSPHLRRNINICEKRCCTTSARIWALAPFVKGKGRERAASGVCPSLSQRVRGHERAERFPYEGKP